jgi:hypothetical protein
MPKYIVKVRERWIQNVAIDASSPDQAIQKVVNGEGDYNSNGTEYYDTLDPETWTVEEVK